MSNRLKELNGFALPLLIQFVFNNLIRLTDKSIVGHISIPAFNAVNLASSTLFVIAGVLGAITVVFNVRGGQKLGKEDRSAFHFEFETSIFLSMMIGFIAFVVLLFSQRLILSKVYALDGESLEQGILFFTPMTFYVLLQLLIFAFTTYFKLHGQTRWILIGGVASSLVNVAIDYLFALGSLGFPKLGIRVVGWSTILALALNLFFYIYILRKEIGFCLSRVKAYFKNAMLHLRLSLEIMAEEFLDGTLMVLLLNAIVIRMGEAEYAGYSILMELLSFLFLFKYIYGSAVLSLTSIARGRSDKRELASYPKIATAFTMLLYALVGVLLLLFRTRIPTIISNDFAAQKVASDFMLAFVAANFISQMSYIYRCALQSMEQYRFVLYGTFPIQLSVLLLMWFWTRSGSLLGVAAAQFVGEILMSLVYYRKYQRELA